MTFESNCFSTSELYKKFLSSINDVKFTLREVDVMACLINNRGEKKIASILDIAPRTVSTHVYNITNKLNCNSRDQIIDFIEATGQIAHFREYYLHLLLKHSFNKFLRQFTAKIVPSGMGVACNSGDMLSLDSTFLQIIKKDCKSANITLDSSFDENLPGSTCFDFGNLSKERYYFDFVEYISSIIKSEENIEILEGLKKDFLESYNSIQDLYSGKVTVEVKKEDVSIFVKLGMAFLVLGAISVAAFAYNLAPQQLANEQEELSPEQKQEVIHNLEQFLSELMAMDFSADNARKQSLQKNHNLFNHAETILDYSTKDFVKQYFSDAVMDSKDLNNYLYNIHALASYYMRNLHDGRKANQLLMHAKQVAENYVNKRSGIKCDFDKLMPDEILAELSIVPDLPEIYTRVLYLIGRSYIYLDEIYKSERYFRVTRVLSDKLNLFEAYIGYTSGLFRVEKYKAAELIKAGKIKKGSEILERIITNYRMYLSSDREFIKDFKPNSKTQERIIPSTTAYNIVESMEVSINVSNKLIGINKKPLKKERHFSKIEEVLRGVDKDIIVLLNEVPAKKAAIFYNNLGNTFILDYDDSLNIGSLKEVVISKLSISVDQSKSLDIAEELFNRAKKMSRATDFTKADSYDGLSRVCNLKAKQLQKDLSSPCSLQAEELMLKVKNLEEKRDKINEALNRKSVY